MHQMNIRMDGRKRDGWIDRWTDGCIGGWVGGWMDGWMDVWGIGGSMDIWPC